MTTAEFIREHREQDVRQLALHANRFPNVDMPYALDQIRVDSTSQTTCMGSVR